MGYASMNLETVSFYLVPTVMFLVCACSAVHLLGGRATTNLVLLSFAIGWFAEYTGEQFGWFFGDYAYTDALGLKVFGVPLVIPIMWFNLCYLGMVLSFLIVERVPFRGVSSVPEAAGIATLAAVLVTAYDLAADPYMVFVAQAWIMDKKDGGWFGMTLQGFAGWLVVSFAIVFTFLMCHRKRPRPLRQDFGAADALIPVLMYACWMCFWILYGYPLETRTVAAFAMGLPVLIILLGARHWRGFGR